MVGTLSCAVAFLSAVLTPSPHSIGAQSAQYVHIASLSAAPALRMPQVLQHGMVVRVLVCAGQLHGVSVCLCTQPQGMKQRVFGYQSVTTVRAETNSRLAASGFGGIGHLRFISQYVKSSGLSMTDQPACPGCIA